MKVNSISKGVAVLRFFVIARIVPHTHFAFERVFSLKMKIKMEVISFWVVYSIMKTSNKKNPRKREDLLIYNLLLALLIINHFLIFSRVVCLNMTNFLKEVILFMAKDIDVKCSYEINSMRHINWIMKVNYKVSDISDNDWKEKVNRNI